MHLNNTKGVILSNFYNSHIEEGECLMHLNNTKGVILSIFYNSHIEEGECLMHLNNTKVIMYHRTETYVIQIFLCVIFYVTMERESASCTSTR